MISGNIFVCLVLLATANYMVAQASQEHSGESLQGTPGRDPKHFSSLFTDFIDLFDFGRREVIGQPGSDVETFGQRDAGPHEKHFGSLFTDFVDLFDFGRREAIAQSADLDENLSQRDASESGSDDDGNSSSPQSRFFFSSFFNTQLVSCNFTSQAGSTCLSCSQVLRCFPSNAGTLKTCHGFFPYCNGGRCSLFPQTNCTATG